MWCVPKLDDEYKERMEDVLQVYAQDENPSEPVVCLDEKSVQLLEHSRAPSLSKPGCPARIDHEYRRKGTANIFACFEPLNGNPILKVTKRRTAVDFAHFLAELVGLYPEAKRIHLVMDNLNTHVEKSLILAFGEEKGRSIWRKFHVHYTPKHASWLNQAELLLSAVSRAALKGMRYPTTEKLQLALTAWTQRHPHFTTDWSFGVEDAREKFKYSQSSTISRAEH